MKGGFVKVPTPRLKKKSKGGGRKPRSQEPNRTAHLRTTTTWGGGDGKTEELIDEMETPGTAFTGDWKGNHGKDGVSWKLSDRPCG